MSEKTAKVVEVLSCKKVTTGNGDVYYHTLKMDNGEVGEIGKKKENFFKPGDSLTYTSTESEYGLKFKAVQNGNYGGRNFAGSAPRGGNESFALSYSKDFHVAMITAGKTGDATSDQIRASILKTAKEFLDWLNTNKS